MNEFCKPCLRASGKKIPAAHMANGEPMCERCFHGGNLRAIADCHRDRVTVQEKNMSTRTCDTCKKPMHGRTKGTTCRACRNGEKDAGGGAFPKGTAALRRAA